MNIAFITHSFHKRTRSHQFVVDLLLSEAQVDIFFDDSWNHSPSNWTHNFHEDKYDVIIIFQVYHVFAHLRGKHPNIVFIPMYDAMMLGNHFHWHPDFNQAKIMCFSSQLRQQVMIHTRTTALFQFFPDPSRYQVITDYEELRGFFWYRVKEINPPMILDLCKDYKFEKLIIHNAPDPAKEHLLMPEWLPRSDTIEMSTWTHSQGDYMIILRRCNVFFAPRPREGIGMSFLEAMASGMCVVAPYAATMNEYISNGTNGLLYQFDRKCRLDLARARDIGLRARESVERGFRRWQASIPMMLEFIATPTAAARSCKAFSPRTTHNLPLPLSNQPRRASHLTVITVCLNAADTLEHTIRSVITQDAEDIEYIIIDGGSTDGTVDVIKRYAAHLAYWHSAPDGGVYSAMNLALQHAQGDWILFLNSDDTFVSSDAVSRMFAHVPEGTDVVYGHHIYRRTDGIEEFHRAADFDVTWDRLRRGELWYDWLAGIPAHQATAIRRSVITNLRFDTRYKIAADHDLLFRARREGKHFFNCDECVAIYVGGGLSAREYERCKREWAAIARTYGDPTGTDRFYADMNRKGASDQEAYQWLHDRARRVVLALHRRSPALGALVSALLRTRAIPWLTRGTIAVIWKTGLPFLFANGREVLKLGEVIRIDFNQPTLPHFVAAVQGLSYPEAWGRWTDGPRLAIQFRDPLPKAFKLELKGYAVEMGSSGSLVMLEIGEFHRSLTINTGAVKKYRINVDNNNSSNQITIDIPTTKVPQRAEKRDCTDSRALGIALISLRIVDNTERFPGRIKSKLSVLSSVRRNTSLT